MNDIVAKANERISRQEGLARLNELVAIIHECLPWMAKGIQAIYEIKEYKLYLLQAKTWDEFCRMTWDRSRWAIDRKIAKMLTDLSKAIEDKPSSTNGAKTHHQQTSEVDNSLASEASAADEKEEENDDTIEARIKEHNRALESWCRQLMKMVETLPNGPWSDHLNCRTSAIQSMKDACGYVRTAKCVSVCPKCDGDGCKTCLDTGMINSHRKGEIG